MLLRFNPFRIFDASKSPAGIYARRKWLGEEGAPGWERDFDEACSGLLAGQDRGGSWDNSVLTTIRRLFGLHLTVRDATPEIQKGLDWLMERMDSAGRGMREDVRNEITSKALRGLPFTRGRPDLFLCGATLFLCSIFGRENNEDVLKAYDRLAHDIFRKDSRWCGWSCSNNVLRAFVVHPHYSRSTQTTKAVQALERVQDAFGKWPHGVPFYQTVNALAHLDSGAAGTQLEPAFKRLCHTQNRDGSWGRSDREWNTFLTLHALKNKGYQMAALYPENKQIHIVDH